MAEQDPLTKEMEDFVDRLECAPEVTNMNLASIREEIYKSDSLDEAVAVTLGAASVCWTESPGGAFRSDWVGKIGGFLVEWILDVPSYRLSFEDEFRRLLKRWAKEDISDTPDYILVRYLDDALNAFERATRARIEFLEGEKNG